MSTLKKHDERRYYSMSRQGDFLVFCIERYRYYKKLSGKKIVELFEKYNVNDYIIKYYESLHTMSDICIVQDIDDYIKSKL